MASFFRRNNGDSSDEKKAAGDGPREERAPDVSYMGEEGEAEDAQDDLHRGMKPRQLNMMAIAGAIGTGLILSSGTALRNGGPGSLLIAYLIQGFSVYTVMVALGEMGTMWPHKKAMSGYPTRFVDPAVGFAAGVNYTVKYLVLLPNNLTASGILIQYWREDLNVGIWITTLGVVIVGVNLLHVSFFGEAEFWMSLVKALVIVMLILICFIIAVGGGPDYHATGFWYWTEPGAFAQYHGVPGATGRFLGVWASIVQASFAYLGTELVGVAFGETPDPRKSVPKAVNQTLFRILFFYIAGVLVIGMTVPYDSEQLLAASSSKSSAAASPFVIAAQNAGIQHLPDAVNALLLVFTISASNSDIYLASRSLFALSKEGQAPAIFHRTNKRGVPTASVAFSAVFILLGYMTTAKGSSTVFGYFVNVVTVLGALNWVAILVSYICMVAAMKAQGVPRTAMPYTNIVLPWGAYIALFMTCLVIVFGGFSAFIPEFQADRFITSYIGIVLFIINTVTWKYWKKTERVRPENADLVTGRRF